MGLCTSMRVFVSIQKRSYPLTRLGEELTKRWPSLPPLLGSENGTEKKELCSHPTGAVYALDMNQVRRVIASASGGSATHDR